MGARRFRGAVALLAAVLVGSTVVSPLVGPARAAAAATLTVTSPVLVFDRGHTSITVASDQASVSYSVADEAGVVVRTGSAAVSGGAGTLDLRTLGPGYYGLSVTAGSGSAAASVSTSFGVLTGFAPGTAAHDARFGMDLHFGHQPNDSTLLALIGHLGIGYTRTDQNWQAVERTPGVYTWSPSSTDTDVPMAKQDGVTTLLIADYTNPLYDGGVTPYDQAGWAAFGAYANAIVDHFGSYTKDVEIYNEFNLGFDDAPACNQTVADRVRCYLALARATHQAVKVTGGHPDANLIGPVAGGIDQPWITGLLDGGLLNDIDTFSFHTYANANPETAYNGVPWLRQQIRAHNGGQDMPLWLTETGEPVMSGVTTDAQQADYAVRLPVLAFASGVDKYFWYDFLNDGSDPTNAEHNFGQLRQPTAGVVADAPKPSLVTQATVLREIGGLPLAGSDGLAAPAYSYRFGSGSTTTRVMWATSPKTVQLATTNPLVVTDEYGRASTYTPVGGAVTLDLDQHPVFVRGAASAVAVDADPAVTLTVPPTTNTDETVRATVTSAGHPGERLDGTIAGQHFTLRADASGNASTTVQVPTTRQLGPRSLVASVGPGSRRDVRLVAHTTVEPATVVHTVPVVVSADPPHDQLSVQITNNRRSTAVSVSKVDWSLTGVAQGTVTSVPDIPAGQTASVAVDVPAQSTWDGHAYTDSVTTGDGTVITDGGTTGWNPIEPVGTTNVAPIDVGTQLARTYPGGYGGASDLSGTIRPSYTADGLVLTADLVDNVQDQPATDPSGMWSGDSIQIAVTPAMPGRSAQRVELGAALLAAGPAVYTWSPPPGGAAGVTPGAAATITRDGTTTHYQVSVPWAALGLTGRPTVPFGLSILVNDNDGAARNWATWGDGIATTKSADLLRPVQLIGD
jgi:hypothetical protein